MYHIVTREMVLALEKMYTLRTNMERKVVLNTRDVHKYIH